jgi:hypothetical protein
LKSSSTDRWCSSTRTGESVVENNALKEVVREALKGGSSREFIRFCDQPPNNTMSCSPPQRPSVDNRIMDILKDLPGVDPKKLRKPKISKTAMTSYLSRCSITQDAIAPILFHILERFLKKLNPGDEAERKIFEYLRNIDSETLEVMKSRLKAFKEIPEDQREGLFDKEILKWPIDKPIPKEKIIFLWLTEGVKLVSARTGNSPDPGLVRPWKVGDVLSRGIKEFSSSSLEGPWPWICGVSTSADYTKWYRNEDFLPDLHGLMAHETAHKCDPIVDKGSHKVTGLDCRVIRPETPAAPTGGFVFPVCEGGRKYVHGDVCLKVPDTFPGEGISLKGFNFFSKNCQVKLTNTADSSLSYTLPCMVLGKVDSPVTADTPSCYKVEDIISFGIPTNHPDGYHDFAAGMYEVTVIVPNDIDYTFPAPSFDAPDYRPKQFTSNPVYLKIEPNPNISYRIWNDWGHCYKETSGGGADEIWIRLEVGKIGDTGIPVSYSMDIPRHPWNDMDSGEDTRDAYNAEIYNDTLPFNGAISIGILAYEVDSEKAAEEKMEDWDEAFGLYLKEVATAVGLIGGAAGASGVSFKDVIGELGVTNSIYLAIFIAVVILVVGLFWSLWAPADRVFEDMIMLNSTDMYKLTDATEPLSPDYVPKFYAALQETVVHPQKKILESIDSLTAEYREKRQYVKLEQDFLTAARSYHVGSNYEILLHYKRNP